ncbi:hypothetical protein V8C86DRAFT_3004185 [Haematococcus lacustris]
MGRAYGNAATAEELLPIIVDQVELARRLTVNVQDRRGGGASARVYSATFDGQHTAIKCLHSTATRREHAQQEFLREAYLLARLAHSNIVQVYALCQLPPAFCGLPTRRYTWALVMELLEDCVTPRGCRADTG